MLYDQFFAILDSLLRPVMDKNIIIYGCQGGDFIRWFCERYYQKKVKAIVDRWELSPGITILHLWSFYYIYDQNDIIINTTSKQIEEEFNDTGEDWSKTGYQSDQIINLWSLIYKKNQLNESDGRKWEISYYDWLEYKYGVDILITIKRKFVKGMHAHGYFPTEFRVFLEGISDHEFSKEDSILDIGCGKGSGIMALLACGFQTVGAVEYTENIYQTLISNLRKMNIEYIEHMMDSDNQMVREKVNCYLGDASCLKKQLDDYNWFFLFNPFSWEVVQSVLANICNSLKEKPRKAYIFYAEPIGHKLIMDTKMFQIKKKLCSDFSCVSYYSYLYESI